MLFNSFEFLLFLPIVFILYWFVFNKKLNCQNGFVLIASYFFYGWWSWKFLGLLIISTALDYTYGFWVASPNRKKAKLFLWLSIINNLGILGLFKYYNFFAVQFQKGFELFGWHTNPFLLEVALPIGISFYTFHGMSYVFDIYRSNQKPVNNFVEYAVFVSFFPLLVAGPIERANHLLPQVQKTRCFNYTQAIQGFRLILWGMFKKIVIADTLAGFVDETFADYHELNGVTLIIGAIAFSFQIYGDFSGYSDMASGTAKLFGFELLRNFKFPFFSRNLVEFWKRWHISLSSWLRDYLYIPLGGSKNGTLMTIRNTYIVFLVSGFWHGANWNCIAWGFIHACGFLPLILINRNTNRINGIVAKGQKLPTFKELLQMLTTFSFFTFALVVFRADGIVEAYNFISLILKSIYNQPLQIFKTELYELVILKYIILLIAMEWYLRSNEYEIKVPKNKWIRTLIYWTLIVTIIQKLNLSEEQKYIYFQF